MYRIVLFITSLILVNAKFNSEAIQTSKQVLQNDEKCNSCIIMVETVKPYASKLGMFQEEGPSDLCKTMLETIEDRKTKRQMCNMIKSSVRQMRRMIKQNKTPKEICQTLMRCPTDQEQSVQPLWNPYKNIYKTAKKFERKFTKNNFKTNYKNPFNTPFDTFPNTRFLSNLGSKIPRTILKNNLFQTRPFRLRAPFMTFPRTYRRTNPVLRTYWNIRSPFSRRNRFIHRGFNNRRRNGIWDILRQRGNKIGMTTTDFVHRNHSHGNHSHGNHSRHHHGHHRHHHGHHRHHHRHHHRNDTHPNETMTKMTETDAIYPDTTTTPIILTDITDDTINIDNDQINKNTEVDIKTDEQITNTDKTDNIDTSIIKIVESADSTENPIDGTENPIDVTKNPEVVSENPGFVIDDGVDNINVLPEYKGITFLDDWLPWDTDKDDTTDGWGFLTKPSVWEDRIEKTKDDVEDLSDRITDRFNTFTDRFSKGLTKNTENVWDIFGKRTSEALRRIKEVQSKIDDLTFRLTDNVDQITSDDIWGPITKHVKETIEKTEKEGKNRFTTFKTSISTSGEETKCTMCQVLTKLIETTLKFVPLNLVKDGVHDKCKEETTPNVKHVCEKLLPNLDSIINLIQNETSVETICSSIGISNCTTANQNNIISSVITSFTRRTTEEEEDEESNTKMMTNCSAMCTMVKKDIVALVNDMESTVTFVDKSLNKFCKEEQITSKCDSLNMVLQKIIRSLESLKPSTTLTENPCKCFKLQEPVNENMTRCEACQTFTRALQVNLNKTVEIISLLADKIEENICPHFPSFTDQCMDMVQNLRALLAIDEELMQNFCKNAKFCQEETLTNFETMMKTTMENFRRNFMIGHPLLIRGSPMETLYRPSKPRLSCEFCETCMKKLKSTLNKYNETLSSSDDVISDVLPVMKHSLQVVCQTVNSDSNELKTVCQTIKDGMDSVPSFMKMDNTMSMCKMLNIC